MSGGPNNFRICQLSILEELKAACPARSVVGQSNMSPLINREFFLCLNTDGIPRPEMNQGGDNRPFSINTSIPRLTALSMPWNGEPPRPCRAHRLDLSEPHGETLMPGEVTKSGWKTKNIVPGEMDCLTILPLHFFVVSIGIGIFGTIC